MEVNYGRHCKHRRGQVTQGCPKSCHPLCDNMTPRGGSKSNRVHLVKFMLYLASGGGEGGGGLLPLRRTSVPTSWIQ